MFSRDELQVELSGLFFEVSESFCDDSFLVGFGSVVGVLDAVADKSVVGDGNLACGGGRGFRRSVFGSDAPEERSESALGVGERLSGKAQGGGGPAGGSARSRALDPSSGDLVSGSDSQMGTEVFLGREPRQIGTKFRRAGSCRPSRLAHRSGLDLGREWIEGFRQVEIRHIASGFLTARAGSLPPKPLHLKVNFGIAVLKLGLEEIEELNRLSQSPSVRKSDVKEPN